MACKGCEECGDVKCPDLLNKDKNKMFSQFCSFNAQQIKPISQLYCYTDPCDFGLVGSKHAQRQGCLNSNLIRLLKKQQDQLDQILKSISKNGKVEIPRIIYTGSNPKLIKSVDLGNVTDDTRIGITWHMGSTRSTNIYTVGDLKGVNSHLFAQNMDDKEYNTVFCETFTRIHDGNKLWITAINYQGFISKPNATSIFQLAHPWNNEKDRVPYYDTQDPDYVAQDPNKYYGSGPGIDYITVYDLVDPISTDLDSSDDSIKGCL